MAEETQLEKTKGSLQRIQEFDAKKLIRKEELGATFAFDDAVMPAERLINLFRLIPSEQLLVFPDQQLESIQQTADAMYSILEDILKFDPAEAEASNRKQQLVEQLSKNYQRSFNTLFPFVSFSVARTVDFNQLATEGRAAVQAVRDETQSLLEEMSTASEKAEEVLQEVRDAAAEQGVTQQARYFSEEASDHKTQAGTWLFRTVCMAIAVVVYAVATLFFPKIEMLSSDTVSGAIQLSVSKFLVFFVLAFLLIQCVRNYTAHRHNYVVNRHRQNALMTYMTLSEAGSTPEAKDTVLQHAAAAIYAPNDSGYTKNEERGYGGNPVIGVMPRTGVSSVTPSDSA